MNKTAIKNFAIWARNKLIADITYKAGLLGITEKGIKRPLPQSTQTVQFFDIGTKEPSSVTGVEIQQRKKLVEEIERKAKQGDYSIAYKNVIEEVAYTWFNRLIAIRFMEVNDYLPTRIRVLSSESNGKAEPDLVTHALEVNLNYTAFEKDRIIQLKHENKLDELFRMLFIKQCNALNTNLPELFEKTSDYSELLLNVSFTDKEGVIYHLVNDIDEDDFDITKEGQVEIIGWMYQYYNTEPKQAVFDGLKKNLKITKEKIPAATQLFTPDWIVRYMVENSLGRLWLESHPNDELKAHWTYYVDEAEQTPEVYEKLRVVRSQSSVKSPEDILLIDPCMGSGHILVYAFDVLMNIYEKEGYNPRDASKIIIEKNIYGLDIDRRAYQLTYFSLMMKARQYNRRIFIEGVKPQVYYPAGWSDGEEYGSLVKIDVLPPKPIEKSGQMGFEDINYDLQLDSWNFKRLLAQKYDVVVTNPPYMGSGSMSAKLSEFVKKNYPDSKKDLSTVFMEKTISLCKSYGFMSMINIPVWMFLPSYEKLRNNLLNRNTYINLIHPGRGIFGSDFGTTAFVIGKKHISGYKGSYRRLFDKQGEVESNEVREYQFLSGKGAYVPQQEIFSKIPGAPVAYWVSPKALSAYNKGKLMSVVGQSTKGIITGDNDRFMRLWWEIQTERINFTAVSDDDAASSRMKWFPCTKGGSFRKWYGNKEYIMDWENRGYRILNEAKFERRNSQDYYNHLKFKQGISWSVLTASTRSFRIENRNLIEHVGMA
uniref:BREX-1 system adenine-specific DNA-methyltransferase PglX n=1 Tax=Proteiniclasticum sp. TaxID=2053595 RepID=UPI002898EFB7